MSVLAALWVALLHALVAPLAAPSTAVAWELSRRVADVRVAGTAGGEGVVAVREARSSARPAVDRRAHPDSDEGVWATRLLVSRIAARTAAPTSVAPPHALPAAAAPRLRQPTTAAWRAAARGAPHRTAALGGHLPYFPTAPPLAG